MCTLCLQEDLTKSLIRILNSQKRDYYISEYFKYIYYICLDKMLHNCSLQKLIFENIFSTADNIEHTILSSHGNHTLFYVSFFQTSKYVY